jgi:8-oxo-dGTP pyrophosphatase MutT (NUDIX family)
MLVGVAAVAIPGWVSNLVTSMNAVDVATVGILTYTATKVARGRPRALIRRARRKKLSHLGVSRDSVHDRVSALLRGETPTAAQELAWLASATGLGAQQSLTFGDPDRARLVADAYAAYAADLDTSALLGANHAPIVRAEAVRAGQISQLAARYSSLVGTGQRTVSLAIPHRATSLEISGACVGEETPLRAQDLLISYRDTRLRQGELALGSAEQAELDQLLVSPNTFDGSLPRLVDWRGERDEKSGRRGLHLSLAETTYGAVVADHYPLKLTTPDAPRDVDGSRVQVLTLSLAVETSCGHVVFARRSTRSGSHQGLVGPAVNGNLEFESRNGVVSDLDDSGLPDLRRALAREAREELGLSLDAGEIATVGLGRFSDPRERGTYVLLGFASIDLDRDQLRAGMRHADPVEGAWELETSLITLALPTTDADLRRAVAWLLGSDELSSHATMAGLGALAVSLRNDTILKIATGSPGLTELVLPPADLVEHSDARGQWLPGLPPREDTTNPR